MFFFYLVTGIIIDGAEKVCFQVSLTNDMTGDITYEVAGDWGLSLTDDVFDRLDDS